MAEFIVPAGQWVLWQSPRHKNAAGNGARDHICGERSELRQCEHRLGQWPAAGSSREQSVAIERAVDRIDGARHARLSHDSAAIRLRLGQNGIGGYHDEGCIGAGDAFDDRLQHLRRIAPGRPRFSSFEGASGLTRNLNITAAEALTRIKTAVSETLDKAKEHPVDRVVGRRKEISLRVHISTNQQTMRLWRVATSGSLRLITRRRLRSSVRCGPQVARVGGRARKPGCRQLPSATSLSSVSRESSSPRLGRR